MKQAHREKVVAGERKQRNVRVVVVTGPPSNFTSSIRKVLWALRRVVEESARNGGIYPPTNRRPRVAQVLKRAGLPPTFLEKRNSIPDARDLRNERLKAKIRDRLGVLEVIDVEPIRSNGEPESHVIRSLRDGWHRAELELVQVKAENTALRRQLAKLRVKSPSL